MCCYFQNTPPGEGSNPISSEEPQQQQQQAQPPPQRFNSASDSSNSTPPSNSASDGAPSSLYRGGASYPTSRSTDPHLQPPLATFPPDASSATTASTPQPQPAPLYSPRPSYSISGNRPPSPSAQGRLVDPRMPSHSMQQPAAQTGQQFPDQSYVPPPPPSLAASQQAIYE